MARVRQAGVSCATMRMATRYTIATLATIHSSPTVLSARSSQPRVDPSTEIHQSVWLTASKPIAPRYTLSSAIVPAVEWLRTGDVMVRHATGRFEFRVTLPGQTDPERVEANLEDGVLTVRIPKPEATRPRRVEVRSSHAENGHTTTESAQEEPGA